MYIQIIGYPKLCNSTLLGTTKENSLLNGTKIEHTNIDIVCSLDDCQSVIINYSVSNIGPQLNYIFIVDLLDYFNNSKGKNQSYFSEFQFKLIMLILCIPLITLHVLSNLSCPRTHSTVLL